MINLTSILKLYAQRRTKQLDKLDQSKAQKNILLNLVKKASNTKFGKEHSFSSINSVEDYQKSVPLRTYEDFWNTYWKEAFPHIENCTWPEKHSFYAVSSGTTSGTTKYLPFTREMEKSNTKAGLDLLVHHVNNYPNSKIGAGKSFMLGGSTDFVTEAPGVYSGDLSGITASRLPWWAKMRSFPPSEIAILSKWEEKIDHFVKGIVKEDIRMISGVPAWLLIFFDAMLEAYPEKGSKIADFFPDLELLVHGGVNFAPYEDRFQDIFKNSKVSMREVYPASEAFIALADNNRGEGLRLLSDHNNFYEFIPLEELNSSNPTRHWINDIQTNVNYAVALTNCGGLWSYIMGDTVLFIDTNPARLKITGRTSYCLSAFGEHLIADEVEDAISKASKSINSNLTDYSVGALFPKTKNDLGGHLYIVEFESKPEEKMLDLFVNTLDKRLSERNEDYDAHRSQGFGLKKPQVRCVAKDTFSKWMDKRGKLGGQHKVPRLISKKELFDDLEQFSRKFTIASLEEK